MEIKRGFWRHLVELIIFISLAILFIVKGWWLALILEAAAVLLLVILLAVAMVVLVLRRDSRMLTGNESVDDLRENVRDAVAWLEREGELWEQRSEDGLLLKGRFLKKEGSHTYAVCCHGYKNIRLQDISNQVRTIYGMGHNVLAGYARGHGFSEGSYIGMGCKERRDVVCWIRQIVEKDPEARIFLYGVSMGGATVMTTSGEELPDNVRCAIEDCGYSSIWKEFTHKIVINYGVPVFPVLYVSQWISRLVYGFGFNEYSALEQVGRAKLPFLFIHGDQDDFVPYAMMKPLYEACASEHKKSVTIHGAKHVVSYCVDPETYWGAVRDWLDTYL